MNRALVELVWQRAGFRCEYCHMPQALDGFTHEIDHVIARKHGGQTISINLVLACFPCNNHKGTNVAGIDRVSNRLTPLFNPRRQRWGRHFFWDGAELKGRSRIGRVTIDVLTINQPSRLLLRQALLAEGVFGDFM